MNSERDMWLYLSIVFILSYLWQGLIYSTGGVDSALFSFLMLFPGCIAATFLFFKKEGFGHIGWRIRKWEYVVLVVFVSIAVPLGLVVLLEGIGWGDFPDDLFVFNDGMLQSTRIGLLLGSGPQTIAFLIANLIISHIVFLSFGSLLTLGEELGWRGYLQEKLLRKYGLNLGFVALGTIWGYWHLPIILMGYNFPTQPVLGALVFMPIGTIFMGMFIGWVYLRTRSIWIPSLAHAAMNLFVGLVMMMDFSVDFLLPSLLWIAAWIPIGVLCLYDLNRNKPELWQATVLATNVEVETATGAISADLS
ncbi:MAG: CPBP family intramembrane metalloprotease [Candidatus Thorarchaeota archaeon]|nr:MAG: CPBP family intramembrane metalloprotease [Candidatus Thorarchaeota archaeon]